MTDENFEKSYDCIENINEEPNDDVYHTLIEQIFDDGSNFYCTKCDETFSTTEDFIKTHQNGSNLENVELMSETDIFDDLIEYDATEEEQELKTEIDDDNIETTADKYFCYDCRTVFQELEAAEQHNCLGIQQTNVDDIESNEKQTTSIDDCTKFVCANCHAEFRSVSILERHSLKCFNFEENKEEVICNICNTKFATQKSLKLHVKIHNEQPMKSIQTVLPELAAKAYNRLDHFFCEICEKSFEKNLLTVHRKMHQHINDEFICKICNRQFDSHNSYEVHKQLHTEGSGGSTKNVIKTGKTEAALRNAKHGIKSAHVAQAKTQNKQTYPCQYCGHVFWRPHEKVRHEYVHTGEKPYACEICGKKFRVPYSLTLHLRTHTEIRPFVCPTCNKRFKSHSVYTHHLRTHAKERTFTCDLCDKSFRTSVQLNAHKNSHLKPFNCTICNRPFASAYAVKVHLKSHEKTKTYENTKHNCTICGAVYGRASALRAHLKYHELEPSLANYYEEPSTKSMDDDTKVDEVDPVSMLLINAAADAEAHREESSTFQFDQCENDSVDNSLVVNQSYLRNEELTLDNFDTEETVITGF